MDPVELALIEQIVSALFQAVQIGIKLAPQLVADLKEEWSLAMSGTTLTDQQRQDVANNCAQVHAQVQAKAALDAQQAAADADAQVAGAGDSSKPQDNGATHAVD